MKISRKSNRLETFDYSQNGAYFVTICVQDRKPLLSRIENEYEEPTFTAFGKIAHDYIQAIPVRFSDVQVDRYILMPDHIHLLLSIDNGTDLPSSTLGDNGAGNPSPTRGDNGTGLPSPTFGDNRTGNPSPTLGAVVGWLKYQITKEINRQRATPGERVFQRSYYDHVIRNKEDYDATWEYIENNPIVWKRR